MPKPDLTTPDLVTLSLLAERPMHGYELNKTLEYREVRDWAGISRPQVYYSLRKLKRLAFIEPVPADATLGPERQTFRSTTRGLKALRDALGRAEWTAKRPPPPFLTWLALSTHVSRGAARRQIERRRTYLKEQIERERSTLDAIRQDEGEMVVVAGLMVELTIRQFEGERAWLDEVESALL